MATEKINLTAPEEPVGINIAAEDTETTTQEILSATDNTEVDADLELSAEDQIESISNNIAELGEEELIALLSNELAETPVQRLRPVVEAIKIAFYKRHRAAIEAERKKKEDNQVVLDPVLCSCCPCCNADMPCMGFC